MENQVFRALADPTRRRLVAMLSGDAQPVFPRSLLASQ